MDPIAGKTIPRIVFWPGSYLDAAPAVVAAPSSPECAAQIFRRPHGFVARARACRGSLPRLCILAWRDDGVSLAFGDGGMALSRVAGAIHCPETVCLQTVKGGCDPGNVLIGGDPGQ